MTTGAPPESVRQLASSRARRRSATEGRRGDVVGQSALLPVKSDPQAQPGENKMDAADLRATQAPIKDRYKTDPKAAMITLKAKGSIENEGIACKVETGRARAVAGWRGPRAKVGV